MDIRTNGNQRNVFSALNRYALEMRSTNSKEFIQDKKLSVLYRVIYRHKNNSRSTYERNTEALSMEFDSNLSPDFCFTHLDETTGKSLFITLDESTQPENGSTRLTMHVQYINEQQELFENIETAHCQSPQGTITNRLQHYKKIFDEQCKSILVRYEKQGFSVKRMHTLENMASWLYHENKRMTKGMNDRVKGKYSILMSAYTHNTAINQYLTMFSVLHNDCFFDDVETERFDLHQGPLSFYCQPSGFRFTPTTLPIEQVECFQYLIEIWRNHSKRLHDIFQNCRVKDGFGIGYLNYKQFKAEFLELVAQDRLLLAA